MIPASVPSVTQPNSSLPDLTQAADEGISRLRRTHRLRVMYPRLERLCFPQRENFWVIGGRPGAFKTALLWNLCLNAAENKQRCLFVSLEMTPGEMSIAAIAKFSTLPRRRIADALVDGSVSPFSPAEQNLWNAGVAAFQGLFFNLRLHGAAENGRSIGDVIRSALKARFDAIFVDHLGMIGRDTPGHELEVLSQSIHQLRGLSRGEARGAKDYRPWVVATSQLNREIDKGDEDRIPRLSDFRGSARIEHDADVAIGLQKRRKNQDEDDPICLLDGFVLKNRNGSAPEVLLFEANGATGLITERRRDGSQPPHNWQDVKDED